MSTFLITWALSMVAACFVITAVIVAMEVRDHRKSQALRPMVVARPAPAPRVPTQRSAAAVVAVHDAAAFDDFLRELIITTHLEDVLR